MLSLEHGRVAQDTDDLLQSGISACVKAKGNAVGLPVHARGRIERIHYREIRYSDLLVTFCHSMKTRFLIDRVATVLCFSLVP